MNSTRCHDFGFLGLRPKTPGIFEAWLKHPQQKQKEGRRYENREVHTLAACHGPDYSLPSCFPAEPPLRQVLVFNQLVAAGSSFADA